MSIKKTLITSLLILTCFLGFSQKDKFSYPNFIGESLNAVQNNPNWKVLLESSGDLNKDGIKDYALILESKDSIPVKICSYCKLRLDKPRIIVVLLNQNGQEKVIIQNNKFIALGSQGGMLMYLEPELFIKKGLLTIKYQYTRATQSYIFKYDNNQMIITKAISYGYSGDLYEDDLYDFVKKIITQKRKRGINGKWHTKTIKIKDKPKYLSEFGRIYDWKLAENHYL